MYSPKTSRKSLQTDICPELISEIVRSTSKSDSDVRLQGAQPNENRANFWLTAHIFPNTILAHWFHLVFPPGIFLHTIPILAHWFYLFVSFIQSELLLPEPGGKMDSMSVLESWKPTLMHNIICSQIRAESQIRIASSSQMWVSHVTGDIPVSDWIQELISSTR